jgi:serine/threonine protein kinase
MFCQELGESVLNEIHILRSIKHQALLELKGVYEDTHHLCLVFEYFKG